MNGLSDLDLVAQAMGSTQPASQQQSESQSQSKSQPQQQSQSQSQPQRQAQSAQSDNETITAQTAPDRDQPLPDLSSLGIDLSTLSSAELAALKPIIDVLGGTSGDEEGEEGEGEDDLKIMELLQQMEAAGLVADDLEGRLDALLENLGETEREIEAGLPSAGRLGQQVNGEKEQREEKEKKDEKGEKE